MDTANPSELKDKPINSLFDDMWYFIRHYSKLTGNCILSQDRSLLWKVYRAVALINGLIYIFECIYCFYLYREDIGDFFFYSSFGTAITVSLIYPFSMWYYEEDVKEVLLWCESRHHLRHPILAPYTDTIFNQAFDFGLGNLRRRLYTSMAMAILGLFCSPIIRMIVTGRYETLLPIHLPGIESNSLLRFVLYNFHHFWVSIWEIAAACLYAGINTIVIRYSYGQFALVQVLLKDLGDTLNYDSKKLDRVRFKQIIDLMVDANK